jgi:hypothetical protein
MEVVLVAYRSRDHLADLLATWPQSLAVAVVDNSNNVDGWLNSSSSACTAATRRARQALPELRISAPSVRRTTT